MKKSNLLVLVYVLLLASVRLCAGYEVDLDDFALVSKRELQKQQVIARKLARSMKRQEHQQKVAKAVEGNQLKKIQNELKKEREKHRKQQEEEAERLKRIQYEVQKAENERLKGIKKQEKSQLLAMDKQQKSEEQREKRQQKTVKAAESDQLKKIQDELKKERQRDSRQQAAEAAQLKRAQLEAQEAEKKQLVEIKKQEKSQLLAMNMQQKAEEQRERRQQKAAKDAEADQLKKIQYELKKEGHRERNQQELEAAQLRRTQYEAQQAEKKQLGEIKKQEKAQLLVMNMQQRAEERKLGKMQHDAEKAERRESWEIKRSKVRGKRAEHAHQRDQEDPRWAFLYKVPSWDFPAIPFRKSDLASVTVHYQYAGKAYSSSDHTQDISKLVFGEPNIRVQDVLLVSKLLREGKVQPYASGGDTTDFYLYRLANEEFSFDGEMEEWRGSIDVARHLTRELSIGFQIPFASRRHELNLQTKLTPAAKTLLSGNAGNFPTKYNHSFQAFLEDILQDKEISLHPKNTNSGIGDITVFVNWDIPTKHVEKFMFGVKLLMPTARDRDIHKLWDAELGNGGFTELSPYCAFVYAHNKFFNPHFYGQITYAVPAYVDRRVPRVRNYDGSRPVAHLSDRSLVEELPDLEGIAFANRVRTVSTGAAAPAPQTKSFNEVDTTVRRFATQTLRIKLHPGPEINLRIGNMLEKVFVKKMFADFYYNLYAKGKTHSGAKLDTSKWDATVLKRNSYKVAHTLGVNLSYQFDKNVRTELGFKHIFIGRNVPELWEINGAARLDF